MKICEENGGLDERGSGGMKEQAFRAIIVPWLSLSIMDVDKSGSIDLAELKCLLWVHQEQGTHEPKDDTVRRTMAVLDLDFSGEIDRMEWVAHNAECDIASGIMVPSEKTMTLFRKIDKTYDANKRIMCNLVRKQIVEQCRGAINFALNSLANEDDVRELESLVQNIAVEIVSDLDPHNIGYCTNQDIHEAKHLIDRKAERLVKYTITLAKVEVREEHLKHEIKLDFKEMENHKGDSNFEMRTRMVHRKASS